MLAVDRDHAEPPLLTAYEYGSEELTKIMKSTDRRPPPPEAAALFSGAWR
jgi:hypothetical protein